MTDARWQGSHLSDEEIDAYWKRQLAEQDEQRIEEHYLECRECQARVQAVETLIDGLRVMSAPVERSARRALYWRIAAALIVSVGLVAAWQWARRPAVTVTRNAEPEQRLTRGAQPADPALGTLAVTPLAPPTRDAAVPVVKLGTAATIMFVLDAREAGPAGSAFPVSLIASDTRVVFQAASLQSSADGQLHVPIRRERLAPGEYRFEVGSRPVVTLPFVLAP